MDKNITRLALMTVAVSASYPSTPEAVLYGISLGIRLAQTQPTEAAGLFDTGTNILADGDAPDAVAAIDAAIAALLK